MNVTHDRIDSLHGLIKVEVTKSDYAENLENTLRDYPR
ncbi:MAG: trigger factor family protein [Odoribacteraceae bacterium]|jgi:hypothetical protein|nr:trigger factor family protein [Odoribacteraceae bacterium]